MLALDWAALGTVVCGSEKAARNVPLVGVCTSRMLQALRDERGVAPERVHVLGLGLGAHVGALAAGCLQGAQGGGLGRLTALDPSLMPSEVPSALDKGSAILVDVLHTSPGDAGMAQPVGNLDFYVNCGQIPQPRCAVDPGMKFFQILIHFSEIFKYQRFTNSFSKNLHLVIISSLYSILLYFILY